jgi:hypothetical protein
MLTAVWVAAISGCSLITDPDGDRQERRVAQFDVWPPGYSPIVLPDTVARGVAFSMVFRTFGNACVEKGGEEVFVDGRTVVVIPFDLYRRGPEVCDDIGRSFEHVVHLRFDEAGIGLVVLNGKERWNMPVTFQRAVVVR